MNFFWKALKVLFKSVISLYIAVFLLLMIVVDREKVFSHARAATLSRFSPSFDDLADTLENHKQFDPKKLREYVEYYEKVVEYTPGNAEAYALLGFFYYHSGKYKKAIALFRKSIKLNPRIFWFYYNLGTIHFKLGQYDQAVIAFKKALLTNPSDTTTLISSSRIYLPIFLARLKSHNDIDVEQKVLSQFQWGYQECSRLLVLSYDHLEDFKQLINYAAEAMQASFFDPEIFYHAGRAAYQLKEYEKAVFFFQECVKEDLNNSDAYYYLGLSLKELNHPSLSQAALQKAAYLRATQDAAFSKKERELRLGIF